MEAVLRNIESLGFGSYEPRSGTEGERDWTEGDNPYWYFQISDRITATLDQVLA